MRIIKIFLISLLCFPVLAGDGDDAKKNIVGRFTDGISNTFGSLTSFDGIKQADLEVDSKDKGFGGDIRATIMSSFSEDETSKTFWLNQTNLSTQDGNETFNTGFIFRRLSEDNKWLSGFNLFYDHELNQDHQRASVGIEIKSTPIEFNSNYYSGLSGDKTVGSSTEKVMDGYDAEVGLQVPYMPTSKLFFSGYEWSGSNYDIKFGSKIGLRLRPTDSLEIEFGAEDNNRMRDHKATGKVTFIKRIGEVSPHTGLNFSSKPFEFKDMSGEVYEKVRRQNRIVKTVTGTVTVARGT